MARKHKISTDESYIYDDLALDLKPELLEKYDSPGFKNKYVQRNRDKLNQMDLRYIIFLSISVIAFMYSLSQYIASTAQYEAYSKQVQRLEHTLNAYKISNEENLSRINSSIDYEEIKRIAIGELGMQYPEEGQIQYYDTNQFGDYVIQVADIPK